MVPVALKLFPVRAIYHPLAFCSKNEFHSIKSYLGGGGVYADILYVKNMYLYHQLSSHNCLQTISLLGVVGTLSELSRMAMMSSHDASVPGGIN